MKKFKSFFLLLLFMLLTKGCTVKQINKPNYASNIDDILNRKSKFTNVNAIGYQYYLPNGIVQKEVNDFNQKLNSKNNTYYLYVDLVSYYNKFQKNYEVNKKAYISKELNNKNKTGYIEVNKEDDFYFVEIMYNYAKIESYVQEDDLIDAISDSVFILSSIKYNDDIVKSILSNDKYTLSDDETYNIFKTKKSSNSNFLKYIEEYDNYETTNAESLIEHKTTKQKDN